MAAVTTKGYRGMGMEGAIARWYDKSTRKDMERFRALAARVRELLPQGGDMLEVAPGPGYFAVEMAKGAAYRVTGLDISRTMVELARKNAAEAGVEVDFRHGNASAMPFPDESFDLLTCSAAFKNFSEPHQALQEMYRVLRPGGMALVVDLRKDVPMSEIKQHFDTVGLGTVERWMTLAAFRFMLLRRAYTRAQFERMLTDVAFREKEVRNAEIGVELLLRK
ncbi:class I SAM-dependent methyltransferase [Mycobacterium sp. SP-6446]|uniref:class I SAM-dependent methyltransferase n=1 Tax=Mycobacterium sp. SP-6446 TaxID=1834162 RepID=UPI001C37C624|nr:class I SAM-dependent methyltransferase [Mycobacterium sp. SP-6446]